MMPDDIAAPCPYCEAPTSAFHVVNHTLVKDGIGIRAAAKIGRCRNCDKFCLFYSCRDFQRNSAQLPKPEHVERLAPEVVRTNNPSIAADFEEAFRVLPVSPRCAAILARRCLEGILEDRLEKKDRLDKMIEKAIESLPNDLASIVDAVRHIGNFATHQRFMMDGTIMPATTHEEALALLDIDERLLRHYYETPAADDELLTKLRAMKVATGRSPDSIKGPKA